MKYPKSIITDDMHINIPRESDSTNNPKILRAKIP
jgi:hypothetical protein